MKVCLVGPAYPYRGGIAHFTAMLARELGKRHDVAIVGFRRLYPSILFPGKTQYDESESPLQVASERLIDSINPWTWIATARRIAVLQPDIVVFQWWQPFFAPSFRAICWLLKRKISVRIIYVCHNVLPHEPSVADTSISRFGLKGADAFLVQSREDGATLDRLLPGTTQKFNPLPVFDLFDRSRFTTASAREHLGAEGRMLLFFGLIRAYKGLATLLHAFARCGDALDATLMIVGEFYEDREPYDRLIAELGIEKRLRIVDDYVPDEQVEPYFRAADVVVLPYVTATQSAIVQTAFSFNKPVIVTDVGGLPDVVTDGRTGFVVPPEDPESLAAAIRRFYAEGVAERMAAAVAADSGRFSWERCVSALLQLSDEAIAKQ